MRRVSCAVLFVLIFSFSLFAAGEYYTVKVNGIIDAANADYVINAIKQAKENNASAVILEMDTPGGMMKSMRTIIDAILSSEVPVISYVTPKGAHSASAGTFILLASHVAAMADGTNIGTASPIDLQGNKAAEKITNDSITYIKNLARINGRNEKWAEEAITKNSSISEKEALALKVIEYTASDLKSLLKQIDGKKIKAGAKEITLNTKDYVLKEVKMPFRNRFLHRLADPNIAYILFLVGIYGIIYELAHFGALIPGIMGAIAIVLGFIGFESVPINTAGIILIVLAVVLFIAEAMTPAFGALFGGGVVSMIIGSLILFPGREAGDFWAPSYFVIGTMVVLTAAFFALIVYLVVKAQKRKSIIGNKSTIGHNGVAQTEITQAGGIVNVGGEDWQAYSDEPVAAREVIEVIEEEGLKLKVKKIQRKKEDLK
ncbi:MAG: serine protease [Candidatus Goldiibacteriota bacterium HGW-Goldbacteria-1]|jgi:membrane-bound serine protease (ClpP class)|nr:MAG: serine protease [Candidatus Goldiibacteriota bacterium HGW-Goldbacteria-1]